MDKSKTAFTNVFLFSLVWAFQILVTKMAFIAGAKVVSFTIQSAFITLIFLTIVIIPKNYRQIISLPKKVFFWLLLINAVHFGLGGFFSNLGVELTSAVNAGFLVKFTLVATTILAWMFLKEKMTILKVLSIVVMVVGSYFITTKGQFLIPQLGDIFIILACLFWSIGNVLVRGIIKDSNINEDIVSFLRPVAGIPILILFIVLSPFYPVQIRDVFSGNYFDLSFFPFVMVAGILGGLNWIFLNRTLKVATASYMTMMSTTSSVFVAVFAIFLLKESIIFAQIFGGILIIIASVITYYSGIDKK